jgi:integrase
MAAPTRSWARRLKRLRTFVRWLQQFEPDTEVPDDTIFGRISERKAPHIYSEQEIIDLLASARRLGPPGSLRGIVFETLFGLIASTGLRISEALSLKNADVDLKTGMLSIHLRSASRQVPCMPARWTPCVDIGGAPGWRAVRRTARSSSAAGATAGGPWATAGASRSPSCAVNWVGPIEALTMARIHDLRHTFVVSASCSGRRRTSISMRRCCRCRPTSAMRW